MMRAYAPAATLSICFAVGCTTEIPSVAPTAFACDSDAPLLSGELPCPESHWCADSVCTPRLDCNVVGASLPGCEDEVSRCEPVFNELTAAVRCENGVHTSTSVRAPQGCDCPDGTHCVAFASGAFDTAYPLYVIPPGGETPVGKLGFAGEVAQWRVCARACSSELNCSAEHTCRPAPVVSASLLAEPASTRHTIGVCYPNLLVPTSSNSTIEQPDPSGCRQQPQCSGMGGGGVCQYRIEVIFDHPRVGAGDAWGTRRALVSRCVAGPGAGMVEDGGGCTEGDDQVCRSGLCLHGRCATPCDPLDPGGVSCSGSNCKDTLVSRGGGSADPVVDRVFVCERR